MDHLMCYTQINKIKGVKMHEFCKQIIAGLSGKNKPVFGHDI